MASLRTNKLAELLLAAGINLLTDSGIKAILVNGSYTPDKDHAFADAITGGTSKELSGTGYVAGFAGSGRKTLASRAVTRDDSADVAFFDCADITWTGINAGTAAYIAIIKEITSDALSPLLCVIDVSPDIATNGGDYTWTVAADGVFKI